MCGGDAQAERGVGERRSGEKWGSFWGAVLMETVGLGKPAEGHLEAGVLCDFLRLLLPGRLNLGTFIRSRPLGAEC